MAERGFLTDTQKEILAGKYEGTDDGEASARYRLRRRTEQAMKELVDVAESDEIEVDDDIWYRYIPTLVDAVIRPGTDFVSFPEFEGSEVEHRRRYPLQYALLDRLEENLEIYRENFSTRKSPGGLRGGPNDTRTDLTENHQK